MNSGWFLSRSKADEERLHLKVGQAQSVFIFQDINTPVISVQGWFCSKPYLDNLKSDVDIFHTA